MWITFNLILNYIIFIRFWESGMVLWSPSLLATLEVWRSTPAQRGNFCKDSLVWISSLMIVKNVFVLLFYLWLINIIGKYVEKWILSGGAIYCFQKRYLFSIVAPAFFIHTLDGSVCNSGAESWIYKYI